FGNRARFSDRDAVAARGRRCRSGCDRRRHQPDDRRQRQAQITRHAWTPAARNACHSGYMNPRPQGIPLRPDPDARRAAAVTAFVRAAIAVGLGARDKAVAPRDILRRQWGDDHLADLTLRAAVAPSTVAGNTAITQVGYAFLDALTGLSAGAA